EEAPAPLAGVEPRFVTRTWGTRAPGSGYEPRLHPGKRGGGQKHPSPPLLVTNLRSTPASGVGARDGCCRGFLGTRRHARQAHARLGIALHIAVQPITPVWTANRPSAPGFLSLPQRFTP